MSISNQGSSSTPDEALPSDLISGIKDLQREKNAVILAHYYQEAAIQDIADYIGDSLGLAQEAQKTDADMIVFAGVVFMAETAKILNPEKTVVLPDMNAGCSLSDNCPAPKLAEFKAQYPNHDVVSYINCSAEVKAISDILCTSANAEKVVRSIPSDRGIIFAPDQHLGRYLMKKTGRDMVLWDGSCLVHETFDLKKIIQLKARHPEAKVIAHPECPESILDHADHIGSTTSLLRYVKQDSANEFIVVTESGILHQMKKDAPDKEFYPAPTDQGCSCSECPYMRLNTLEKIYLCMKNETPQMILDQGLMQQAKVPLDRMLALS
jgi:quinolinate synthase